MRACRVRQFVISELGTVTCITFFLLPYACLSIRVVPACTSYTVTVVTLSRPCTERAVPTSAIPTYNKFLRDSMTYAAKRITISK